MSSNNCALNTAPATRSGSRLARAAAAAALAATLLSGCASASPPGAANQSTQATPQPTPQPTTQGTEVRVADAWIKAAPTGMTSAFAQLHNTTDREQSLVSVSSEAAGSIELHDMTGSGTSMSMEQLEGPLAIPANSTVTLAPGGKHLMLMDLREELQAGSTASMVFTFADQSTQEVQFEIKEFSGAKESYAPEAEHAEHGEH